MSSAWSLLETNTTYQRPCVRHLRERSKTLDINRLKAFEKWILHNVRFVSAVPVATLWKDIDDQGMQLGSILT